MKFALLNFEKNLLHERKRFRSSSLSSFEKPNHMTQQAEEVAAHSFGKRFKTALKNLCIGSVFIIAGFFLLWHNESKVLEKEIQLTQAKSVLSEKMDSASNQQDTEVNPVEDVKATTFFNWSLRTGGWVILFMGLATLFKPLVVLVEKIPLLGNFVGRGITVFSLLSSFSLTLIIMSAVWMVARPVFGAILLVLGIIPLLILYRSGKRARLKHALKQL